MSVCSQNVQQRSKEKNDMQKRRQGRLICNDIET